MVGGPLDPEPSPQAGTRLGGATSGRDGRRIVGGPREVVGLPLVGLRRLQGPLLRPCPRGGGRPSRVISTPIKETHLRLQIHATRTGRRVGRRNPGEAVVKPQRMEPNFTKSRSSTYAFETQASTTLLKHFRKTLRPFFIQQNPTGSG